MHPYAHVLRDKPCAYWDYEGCEPEWSTTDGYEIVSKLGRGKYSEVFEAVKNNSKCVIKVLRPTKHMKVQREVKILQTLKGGAHILTLVESIRDTRCGTLALVFEYLSSTDLRSVSHVLSPRDVRFYMSQLLVALDYAHSRGVMHRDVKPQNIIVSLTKKHLKLIDWGLADFYHYNKEYNVRVASRYYKAPELLVEFTQYNYSNDMWSFGCVFAALVFRIEVLFKGSDNADQLLKITQMLGTNCLSRYIVDCAIQIDLRFNEELRKCPAVSWTKFLSRDNSKYATPIAIDLIKSVLLFNHKQRLTAQQALTHPYFG